MCSQLWNLIDLSINVVDNCIGHTKRGSLVDAVLRLCVVKIQTENHKFSLVRVQFNLTLIFLYRHIIFFNRDT